MTKKGRFDLKLRDAEDRRVVGELRKIGLRISSIWDLVNTSDSYPEAIPVLVKLLPTIREEVIKDGVVRSLTCKEARGVAERPLLREFFEEPAGNKGVKWTIGNALNYLAGEELYEPIVKIVKDRSHGGSRKELVAWLGKMKSKKPGVVKLLIELLEDDDVIAHALGALRRLKAVEARRYVEPLLKYPSPSLRREPFKTSDGRVDPEVERSRIRFIRREAAKTLKAFDAID